MTLRKLPKENIDQMELLALGRASGITGKHAHPDDVLRLVEHIHTLTDEVTTEQVAPRPAQGDCWLLVLKDMEERRQHGIAKYGQPVQPFNGRDPLVDAYQEALDLCVYLRQAIEEHKHAQ